MSNPSPAQPASPERIHLIFKTHLDVGFTDFAETVIDNYFKYYIPKAIELARLLRETGTPERFVWTTGSWLIYEYLEQAGVRERRQMEDSIAVGDIAWHALPFTTHSEAMDAGLFRFGLSLSQKLDRRFGKHTIAAKMTDVPGHTRGIVPLLAEAGVRFLHIGVNGASTPPDVPPVFIWRDPSSSAEVIVMYHKGTYGDLMIVPGISDAIAFAHTGDNLGPQSRAQLLDTFQALRERFPKTEIVASTMDAFANQILLGQPDLPVIQHEIGDTWIHGTATDPQKMAHFRELLRWRTEQLEAGIAPSSLEVFHQKLLLIPEHTWGLDVKTHLNDWQNYRPAEFQAARERPNFKKMEASWQEQRGYLRQAVEALPDDLRAAAEARLIALGPVPFERAAYTQIDDRSQSVSTRGFEIGLNSVTGAVIRLERNGTAWASPDHPLGSFLYETFSADDYRRFHQNYNVNKRETQDWAIPDFTKPGLDEIAKVHQAVHPLLTWAGTQHTDSSDAILLELEFPDDREGAPGAPRRAMLELRFPVDAPEIHFDLRWFEKPACRLPEALWFSFLPRIRDPRQWRMDKLGLWISPLEVIRDGNRHLHAVGSGGIRTDDPTATLSIRSLDSALVAPGQPSLLNFNNRRPNLRHGFHFNLYNNIWGTNFPMWYEDNARFRFILRIEEKQKVTSQ